MERISLQLSNIYNLAFQAGADIRFALRDDVTHPGVLRAAQRAADRITTLLDEDFKPGLGGLVEKEGE